MLPLNSNISDVLANIQAAYNQLLTDMQALTYDRMISFYYYRTNISILFNILVFFLLQWLKLTWRL